MPRAARVQKKSRYLLGRGCCACFCRAVKPRRDCSVVDFHPQPKIFAYHGGYGDT